MNDQASARKKTKKYKPNILGRLFLSLLVRLPVSLLAKLGRGFGLLFYIVDYRRTKYAKVNLEICFPELSDKERKKLLINHFKFLGYSLFCTLGVTWYKPRERLTKYINIKNLDILEGVIKNKQPVILLAPHFAGVDLMFSRLAMSFIIAGMYRPPRKNLIHWAIDHKRRQFNSIPILNDGNLKKMIRVIRDGSPFYYAPDLDQGRNVQYVFAPFFGRPAATVTALNRIASMTNAKVILCTVKSIDNDGHFEVTLSPPLENFPTNDLAADAARVNKLIEDKVRQSPAEYFWLHRRFKTQEDGARELYK